MIATFSDQIVRPNQFISFKCAATGSPPPQVTGLFIIRCTLSDEQKLNQVTKHLRLRVLPWYWVIDICYSNGFMEFDDMNICCQLNQTYKSNRKMNSKQCNWQCSMIRVAKRKQSAKNDNKYLEKRNCGTD